MVVVHPLARCFSAPISVKVTSSGDEGWECEEGDCVWYPLEGLPGLGLELPEEPAYRITPPPADKRHETFELRVWGLVIKVYILSIQSFRIQLFFFRTP